MSEDNKIPPEAVPTKDEFKAMLGGLKDLINTSPKKGSRFQKPTDIVDKGYYYNEREAKGLIPYLDEILLDKEDRQLLYSDYPQWNPNTLWAKINQAIKYVVDNLDTPECKYRNLRNSLKISKEETGIFFRYVENNNPSGQWVLHKVKDSKKMLENYKTRVFKFMEESNEGETLDIKEGINLSNDEVEQMKALFTESPIFMAFVSNNRIKIIHVKEEDNANSEISEDK